MKTNRRISKKTRKHETKLFNTEKQILEHVIRAVWPCIFSLIFISFSHFLFSHHFFVCFVFGISSKCDYISSIAMHERHVSQQLMNYNKKKQIYRIYLDKCVTTVNNMNEEKKEKKRRS